MKLKEIIKNAKKTHNFQIFLRFKIKKKNIVTRKHFGFIWGFKSNTLTAVH